MRADGPVRNSATNDINLDRSRGLEDGSVACSGWRGSRCGVPMPALDASTRGCSAGPRCDQQGCQRPQAQRRGTGPGAPERVGDGCGWSDRALDADSLAPRPCNTLPAWENSQPKAPVRLSVQMVDVFRAALTDLLLKKHGKVQPEVVLEFARYDPGRDDGSAATEDQR